MYEAMKAYYDIGFQGVMRPDHAPVMWGEENTEPGYMPLGRLFAVGLHEGPDGRRREGARPPHRGGIGPPRHCEQTCPKRHCEAAEAGLAFPSASTAVAKGIPARVEEAASLQPVRKAACGRRVRVCAAARHRSGLCRTADRDARADAAPAAGRLGRADLSAAPGQAADRGERGGGAADRRALRHHPAAHSAHHRQRIHRGGERGGGRARPGRRRWPRSPMPRSFPRWCGSPASTRTNCPTATTNGRPRRGCATGSRWSTSR